MIFIKLCLVIIMLVINKYRIVKGAGLFPTNSGLGIFFAVAVPLDLPNRNVFMSYNFEANYNLPYLGSDAIPGPLKTFLPIEDIESARKFDANVHNSKDQKQKRSFHPLLTRKSLYKMFEEKLKTSGYKGKACLLKLICETNSSNLNQPNGVVGNIVHIIFTPSSSIIEEISQEYINAENDGGDLRCSKYDTNCPQNIFEIISNIETY